MFRKKIKLFLILPPVLVGIFAIVYYGEAASCGTRSIIGNSPPYWGTVASQNVTLTNGSQVRISIKGEDGCAGQNAQYQIFKGSSLVFTINLPGGLIKGNAVSGQTDAYILYGDWTINLGDGDYKVKLIKVDNKIYSSSLSSNTLTVGGVSQACNLDKVYANPNGGKPGEKIKATVEGKGSCQGWGVTINIDRTTGGTNTRVLNGSEQKFQSGNNKLEWEWTLPALTVGSEQASYKITAHLGSQNLESPPFLVTICTGGVGGACNPSPQCNNNGTCDAGETQTSCSSDCKTGGTSGAEQKYSFDIPNPLKGGATDFAGLVRILAQWLFNLAIPIAVAMIVYSGILFLTAQGDPGKVTKAKDVLKYAIIGLAIILIGSGFVTLIQSILELGSPSLNSDQPTLPTTSGNTGVTTGTLGVVGNKCSGDRDCTTGLKCQDSICKRSNGNWDTEPCNSARNCDVGLLCDKSDFGLQPIDGQNLGTCSSDISISGGRIGDVCQSDSNCISGLKCNQICQRKDGNLIGESCVKTSSPSNCQSRACRTVGTNLVGDCISNPQ